MRDKIIWYLKQLFPFTYRTFYAADGVTHYCVWNMWMGRCFHVDDLEVTRKNDPTMCKAILWKYEKA
jgi:hypothetical protein